MIGYTYSAAWWRDQDEAQQRRDKPFRLWGRVPNDPRWGIVGGDRLRFASIADGETVAARYRALYPRQAFAISINAPEGA